MKMTTLNKIFLLIILSISLSVKAADFTVTFQPAPNSVGDTEISSVSSSKISDFVSAVTAIVNSLVGGGGGGEVQINYVNNTNFPLTVHNTISSLGANVSNGAADYIILNGGVPHSVDVWYDLPNSHITITPTEASEHWRLRVEGSTYLYRNSVGGFSGHYGIFDQDNNLVDGAMTAASMINTGIGYPIAIVPLSLTARVTLTAPKTFKIRMKLGGQGEMMFGANDLTGGLTGDETGNKFYAERITN